MHVFQTSLTLAGPQWTLSKNPSRYIWPDHAELRTGACSSRGVELKILREMAAKIIIGFGE